MEATAYMKLRMGTAIAMGLLFAARLHGADLRLGMIGTDTSHATEFTRTLNDAAAIDHVEGARIVVAYKGGSPDVEESRSRVDRFASELRDKYAVRFVEHIPEMCGSVDGFLLESVDGRTHLAQLKELLGCGKPVFIDKPLASSWSDASEITRLAAAAGVGWFSASSLRFSDIESLKRLPVKGAIVWAPGPIEPHQPLDLSWYGIHGAEMLFTLMGRGCVQVTRSTSKDADVVTCVWADGRIGTVRVDRPHSKYGAVVFRSDQTVDALPSVTVDYPKLVRQIVQFMTTGAPPVPNAETLEIFAFLDAAQRSKESGGLPVSLHREKP
jgi:hypothetical protein